ncbi:MAG: hypothetical protein ACT6SF_14895 [Hydrogenophaga sp.]|jgi:hypothetical protein|uniref:hypothetical protein n=1 Tax=Hydrogenophaga sp. TaxID=1904254 RepID=UPI001DD67DB5|nr:hypothetical protein [Hydrogenophaga sp.]MBW0169196.1 hypothetical protein [Hydrogenophaga sp.]MBW0184097.1 hypothetical protein [Hydrogenophaga sp.]
MNPSHSPIHLSTQRVSRACLAFAAGVVLAAPVWAAGATAAKAPADAAYHRDRAACQAMASAPDRTHCLRDVAAARQQAQSKGAAPSPSPQELERNAVQRCQAQPPEQQAICERMARGEGSVSGSVQGGGVIRELVTQEPAPVR